MEVCDVCRSRLEVSESTDAKPYHYTECGLSFVYLVGVRVYRCPKCQAESAAIPHILGLHALIAQGLLLSHVPLAGREFRFLRKEATLGLPELAERMHVDRQVILDFELGCPDSARDKITCRLADAQWLLG